MEVVAVAKVDDGWSDSEDLDDDQWDEDGSSDTWDLCTETQLLVLDSGADVPWLDLDWVANASNGLPFESGRLIEFWLEAFDEECW